MIVEFVCIFLYWIWVSLGILGSSGQMVCRDLHCSVVVVNGSFNN